MARLRHQARRYGYRIKRRFQEAPFSTMVLWAVFLSIFFLVFAFRGLIATLFISPSGIINPSKTQIETPVDTGEEPPSPIVKLQGTGTYTVQSGDTLYGIAVEIGSTTAELAEINELEPPYNLSVGQELKLP